MFTCKFSQNEVTHHRLRGRFKKVRPDLSCGRSKGRPAWVSVSRRGPPLFEARSVHLWYVSTEKWRSAARLRVEALQRVDVKPLRRGRESR
jgi:hypothetical protein